MTLLQCRVSPSKWDNGIMLSHNCQDDQEEQDIWVSGLSWWEKKSPSGSDIVAHMESWRPQPGHWCQCFSLSGKGKKMSQLERSVLQQKLNKHCKKKCIYKVMPLEILYFMEDEYSVFYILVLSETGFISLQSKRLSRVFSSTTVQKHQWNCRKTKTQK